MHSIKVSIRLVALFAVALVAVLAFASLSPGTRDKASATIHPQNFTFVFNGNVKADKLDVGFKKNPDFPQAVLGATKALVANPPACPVPVVGAGVPPSINSEVDDITIPAGHVIVDWGEKCVQPNDVVKMAMNDFNDKDQLFVKSVIWSSNGVALPIDVVPPSVVCTDFWLGTKDLANPDDLRVAVSMSRIEPSQNTPGKDNYDVITALYIGPDQKPLDEGGPGADLVPDVPPTLELCQKDYADGLAGPEANQMHPFQLYEARSNNRPSTQAGFPAVLTKDGTESHLIWSACGFSEGEKQWFRIDTDLNITAGTAPGDKSTPPAGPGGEIVATLHLGTDEPTDTKDSDGDGKPDVAINPAECATNAGTVSFPSQGDTIFRNVTTDFPNEAKNAGIATDPDGPTKPTKTQSQLPDSADGLADDWDGDGCTDWDELDKDFVNGRDPFNPNDCNIDDFTGSYSAIATVQAATDGTAGSYFHAIIAIQHDTGDNTLTGALQVYIDSQLLSNAGPKNPVPTKQDGNPGAPPPPPYTVSAPTTVTGSFDKVNQLLIFDFCVRDIGGLFAPNVISHAEVDVHTLKGTVSVAGNQTQAACDSLTANAATGQIVLPPTELVLVRQGLNQNYDKDKCTDMEELLGTGPATCGDDPYNPHDSDENHGSVGNLLVTVFDCGTGTLPNCGFEQGTDSVGGADWDKGLGEIIPGIYYHCITDMQHDKDTDELQLKAFCYIDSQTPGICQINVEAYPGVCGDGIAGAGPPWPASKNPSPYEEAWADVDTNQTKLTGTYDPVAHELNIAGCFADKDGFGAQGNVYVDATIDSATGQGQVQLTILIGDTAECIANTFADGVPFPIAKIEYVEQANKAGKGAGYDTDRDGCSDKEELTDNQVFGGLRDPYKYWDFYDPDQNRQIALGDFLAVLSRFGASDLNNTTFINRHTDPLSDPPAPPAYHPRFDRGGQQAGTAGMGWNETPPDGALALGDFLSLLRQFGHTCVPGPNDPAYPYAP